VRPPSRIEGVLAAVQSFAVLHHDLTLIELLTETVGRDPFYIEDDDLVKLFYQLPRQAPPPPTIEKAQAIDHVFQGIRMAWKTMPDMRFGQFVVNYVGDYTIH
jgi:hypothetical protein